MHGTAGDRRVGKTLLVPAGGRLATVATILLLLGIAAGCATAPTHPALVQAEQRGDRPPSRREPSSIAELLASAFADSIGQVNETAAALGWR
jgi:hypothetical protein